MFTYLVQPVDLMTELGITAEQLVFLVKERIIDRSRRLGGMKHVWTTRSMYMAKHAVKRWRSRLPQ